MVNTLAQGAELIAAAGSRGVRLLADTYHMNIEEDDLCEALRASAGVLGAVHLSDSNRHQPGAGHVPFDAIRRHAGGDRLRRRPVGGVPAAGGARRGRRERRALPARAAGRLVITLGAGSAVSAASVSASTSRARARAVLGGHEAVADPQREGEHAADLDVVLVGAEGAEQRAQVVHPPVVDAAQAVGDRLVAPGPVADREVGRQQPPWREEASANSRPARPWRRRPRPRPARSPRRRPPAPTRRASRRAAPGGRRSASRSRPWSRRAPGPAARSGRRPGRRRRGLQPRLDPAAAGRAGSGHRRIYTPPY